LFQRAEAPDFFNSIFLTPHFGPFSYVKIYANHHARSWEEDESADMLSFKKIDRII
jgi:hypothetical protein